MATALIGLGAGIVSGIAGLFGAGGPSPAEQALTANETQLMQNLSSSFGTRFAQQSNVLGTLNNQLANTAFFEQPGMSAQEYAARQSQIIGSTGQATTSATQSALAAMAGRGAGGSSSLISGPESGVIGGIEAQGALSAAQMENQLTSESYAIGRQLAGQRIAGETEEAKLLSPVDYAQAAAALGATAGKEAQTTREATNAQQAQKVAGFTGLATAGINALGANFGGATPQISQPEVSPGMMTQTPTGFDPNAGLYLNEE